MFSSSKLYLSLLFVMALFAVVRAEPPLAVMAADGSVEGKDNPVGGAADAVNYLVTLSRQVSQAEKDSLFDLLTEKGAIVKQVYDYRVYKGVLFSIPSMSDKGISVWQDALSSLKGVKYVEEDQVIKIN